MTTAYPLSWPDTIARALCKAAGDVDFDVSSPQRQTTYRRMAMAAGYAIFDALADPSEEMIRAPFADAPAEFLSRDDVRDIFRSMLFASPLLGEMTRKPDAVIYESNAGSGSSHFARMVQQAEAVPEDIRKAARRCWEAAANEHTYPEAVSRIAAALLEARRSGMLAAAAEVDRIMFGQPGIGEKAEQNSKDAAAIRALADQEIRQC